MAGRGRGGRGGQRAIATAVAFRNQQQRYGITLSEWESEQYSKVRGSAGLSGSAGTGMTGAGGLGSQAVKQEATVGAPVSGSPVSGSLPLAQTQNLANAAPIKFPPRLQSLVPRPLRTQAAEDSALRRLEVADFLTLEAHLAGHVQSARPAVTTKPSELATLTSEQVSEQLRKGVHDTIEQRARRSSTTAQRVSDSCQERLDAWWNVVPHLRDGTDRHQQEEKQLATQQKTRDRMSRGAQLELGKDGLSLLERSAPGELFIIELPKSRKRPGEAEAKSGPRRKKQRVSARDDEGQRVKSQAALLFENEPDPEADAEGGERPGQADEKGSDAENASSGDDDGGGSSSNSDEEDEYGEFEKVDDDEGYGDADSGNDEAIL
ncbi:hypothetical protein FVE85_7916 [Porphyridium purpureum]|uniref:DNA-directed RNA polymerase III subunit n=1 Tax=Porphyridium purpureum TaxID=35688 RepID=A0A5J4YLP7_PORPP|nr:hypothetical protein FVE85_7916 [Porphyridium purpureum]|eukprot:POR5312..scf295_9